MKGQLLFLRLVPLLLILIHLYQLFTKEQVPRWSYGLFAFAMLMIASFNIRQYLKSHK